MSDEFLSVATYEINEELRGIMAILDYCTNDYDVTKNSKKIEQHMHKIKGLAPMMGKENVGNLAGILDSILKKITSGKKVDGFFNLLTNSVKQMRIAMDKQHDLGETQKQVSDLSLKIID